MERTFILLKPDCVQRGLLGKVISRFEDKGLKIVAAKMMKIDDELLDVHYEHLKDKPFFPGIKNFMSSSPVLCMVIEGKEAVEMVRKLCGVTNARKADVGTIRGDLSMSMQCNIIHASDSIETAEKEIERFFKKEEVFDYEKKLVDLVYSDDEKGN